MNRYKQKVFANTVSILENHEEARDRLLLLQKNLRRFTTDIIQCEENYCRLADRVDHRKSAEPRGQPFAESPRLHSHDQRAGLTGRLRCVSPHGLLGHCSFACGCLPLCCRQLNN